VDLLRQLKRRQATSVGTQPTERLDASANDPADVAAAKDERERLAATLEELRVEHPEYEWLLREHFLRGRPIKELAAEKGVTEHAIHGRMTRALKAMRRLLSRRHPGNEASP
jgi:DNA-directed RNA polymerase specialized sigma24 family protein